MKSIKLSGILKYKRATQSWQGIQVNFAVRTDQRVKLKQR